jgi:hypothetical protein
LQESPIIGVQLVEHLFRSTFGSKKLKGMIMNQDGVSIAFEVILEEIGAVENQLAAEGSAAFRERRYNDADLLSNSGKKLLQFREKLVQLRDEWRSGIDIETRQRVKVEPGYTISPHSKGPKTILRVTIPNGRVIERPTAAQTFADVIEEMGIEVVRKLNIHVSGIPLVDIKRDQKCNQAKRGSYFINTHSNTISKKNLLKQIGERLGKALRIEIV